MPGDVVHFFHEMGMSCGRGGTSRGVLGLLEMSTTVHETDVRLGFFVCQHGSSFAGNYLRENKVAFFSLHFLQGSRDLLGGWSVACEVLHSWGWNQAVVLFQLRHIGRRRARRNKEIGESVCFCFCFSRKI